jgi:diacylglycerol kinase
MPNKDTRFSWHARAKSFTYAWSGIKAILQTEHNTWIHLAFTIVATILGFVLHISRVEFMVLIIVMALVWVTEMLNTCIEKTMDFITLEQHPQIKIVKDIAAAAVLVMSMAAVVVGCLIFIPKLIYYASIYSNQ